MSKNADLDYALTGWTIQRAMVDQAKKKLHKSVESNSIVWNGRQIKTYNIWRTRKNGVIRAEFLFCSKKVEQGFDIDIDGWLELENGEHVKRLRTWHDVKYEEFVEYPFYSKDGTIKIWNVYKKVCENGLTVEERLTGNAGFWVETVNSNERLYHCSHGMAHPPDFESLVFKVSIA